VHTPQSIGAARAGRDVLSSRGIDSDRFIE
jgi:hypothetical protein